MVQGKRIYLEKLDPDHLSDEYVAWMRDPEVLRYLSTSPASCSIDKLKEFVVAMNTSGRDYLWGIYLKDSHRHIGNIKIGNVHSIHQFGDLGLIIGVKALWGQGYATEVIKVATQYAFDQMKLRKVIAGIFAPNQASYRAFLKAGYREVGRYAKHCLFEGRFVDKILFEKCADGALPENRGEKLR